MAHSTGIFTGTFLRPDGSPAQGSQVHITPNEPIIRDAAGKVVMAGVVVVDLDDDGAFSHTFAATDDDRLDPTEFRYTINPRVKGYRPVTGVPLPAGETVDYSEVVSIDPDAPEYAPWTFGTGMTMTETEAGSHLYVAIEGGSDRLVDPDGDHLYVLEAASPPDADQFVTLDPVTGHLPTDVEERISDLSSGDASALIATHEAAANPHPVYLTAAEGAAAYDALGAASTAQTAAIAAAATDATTKANAAQAAAISTAASDATTKANAAQAAAIAASQPLDADLTAFAGKTAPSGAVVGTTDTQTLTNKTLTTPAISSPTGLVKGDIGLSSVDNTADTAKPVSTAQQTALNLKANLASPTFTGTVAGITAAMVGAQPVDSDLTSIAASSTTTFGRARLTDADAAAARTALVLGTMAVADANNYAPVAQLQEHLEDLANPHAVTAAQIGAQPATKNTIAFVGDSLTAQSVAQYATGNIDYAARGFVTWALIRLGHRLEHVYPSGGVYIGAVSGENTAEVLARISTITALSPGWVHVLAGTNDIANVRGGTLATAITNLGTYYDTLTAAGIRIVAGTIPPKATALLTDTQRRQVATLNNWIRSQALSRPGFVLVDYHQILSGADGDYRIPFATSTAYSSDGTHESTGGAMRMGQALADALDRFVPPASVLPTSNFDDDQTSATTGENLLGSFSMLTGSGGTVQNSGLGVAATGWTLQSNTGTIGGVTGSKVTRDDCPGEWQQLVSTTSTEQARFTKFLTMSSIGLVAGETAWGLCEFEAENLSAFAYAHLIVIFTDSTAGFAARGGSRSSGAATADYAVSPPDYFPPRGVFKTYPLTVPANADSVSVSMEFRGIGTIRFARPTLRRI